MFIELTEVLACPACLRSAEPPQGLVAIVERLRERHVQRGYLGCPGCEARYPVRDGVVDFARADAGDPGGAGPGALGRAGGASGKTGGPPAGAGGPAAGAGVPYSDVGSAPELAALLGLAERPGGTVLLDVGLAPAAVPLATLVPALQLLGLVDRLPPEGSTHPRDPASVPGPGEAPSAGTRDDEGDEAVSYARVSVAAPLPVGSGRVRAIALQDRGPERLREAVRALEAGGRLVVLRPGGEVLHAARALPLRVVAAEARALVAVRG